MDGVGKRGESGAAAEDEALEQGVRRQAVRAVHAGAGALARGVEARNVRPAVEIRDDAAHRVVGRRGDGNRLQRRVEALPLERVHERRKAAAIDAAQVEQRRPALADRAGHDVARRELVGKAVALGVDQHGPFATQRLAEQQAVLRQHGRVELHELEVGEPRPGTKGHGHAVTGGAGRIRRPLPERRRAARGDERCPRLDRPPIA